VRSITSRILSRRPDTDYGKNRGRTCWRKQRMNYDASRVVVFYRHSRESFVTFPLSAGSIRPLVMAVCGYSGRDRPRFYRPQGFRICSRPPIIASPVDWGGKAGKKSPPSRQSRQSQGNASRFRSPPALFALTYVLASVMEQLLRYRPLDVLDQVAAVHRDGDAGNETGGLIGAEVQHRTHQLVRLAEAAERGVGDHRPAAVGQ